MYTATAIAAEETRLHVARRVMDVVARWVPECDDDKLPAGDPVAIE